MTEIIRNPKTEGMAPKHNRKLVFSGVALTLGSMDNDLRVMGELKDTLEPLMINSGYLNNAPFLWVGIVFLYGLKNETVPHYQRIHKKYGDLPLTLELDMRIFLTADEEDPELLKEFFEIATLDCLTHAGKKYKLPIEALEARRAQLGVIPDWEYDMEEFPEIMIQKYQASKPEFLH